MVKGYFIQYKFIIPDSIKHSAYTYQKLFRALYGYTQNVTKSNGKTYIYHRKGVLSDTPYLRPGKNCVIISPQVFVKLKNFFHTGQNPSHNWRVKGDWKAVYYMDEKELSEDKVLQSLEELTDRTYVFTPTKVPEKLVNELDLLYTKVKQSEVVDDNYKKVLLEEAQKIISHEWFKDCASKSTQLSALHETYKKLRGQTQVSST